jgi:hypothetical protein
MLLILINSLMMAYLQAQTCSSVSDFKKYIIICVWQFIIGFIVTTPQRDKSHKNVKGFLFQLSLGIDMDSPQRR